ncbi:MAG: hypothetical protein KDD45_15410, partial [Bdellovibrionales bacterium]|nr:hypothetical protein [Bdellovibrionales bacterium]
MKNLTLSLIGFLFFIPQVYAQNTRCSNLLNRLSWEKSIEPNLEYRSFKVFHTHTDALYATTVLNRDEYGYGAPYLVIKSEGQFKKTSINVQYDEVGNIIYIRLSGMNKGIYSIQFLRKDLIEGDISIRPNGEP